MARNQFSRVLSSCSAVTAYKKFSPKLLGGDLEQAAPLAETRWLDDVTMISLSSSTRARRQIILRILAGKLEEFGVLLD